MKAAIHSTEKQDNERPLELGPSGIKIHHFPFFLSARTFSAHGSAANPGRTGHFARYFLQREKVKFLSSSKMAPSETSFALHQIKHSTFRNFQIRLGLVGKWWVLSSSSFPSHFWIEMRVNLGICYQRPNFAFYIFARRWKAGHVSRYLQLGFTLGDKRYLFSKTVYKLSHWNKQVDFFCLWWLFYVTWCWKERWIY